MDIPIYQIDAFTTEVFKGNPAAVCPRQEWLPDETMQKIAFENNLSETAFFVQTENGFHIRWFAPTNEVDLCGHATLATAYVIFNVLEYEESIIEFESKSGALKVIQHEDNLILDFPAQKAVPTEVTQELINAINHEPLEVLESMDLIVLLGDEKDVVELEPKLDELKNFTHRGLIVTAQSDKYDFVASCFFPGLGIDEDPVTGSAYTQLVPYWEGKLGKDLFSAKQVSERGGELICELYNDRVMISGKAVMFMEGKIEI